MTPEPAPERDEALDVNARVTCESGRWVVHLCVNFWNPAPSDSRGDPMQPIEAVWKRIADFPTEQAARRAARLYERVADRQISPPSAPTKTTPPHPQVNE